MLCAKLTVSNRLGQKTGNVFGVLQYTCLECLKCSLVTGMNERIDTLFVIIYSDNKTSFAL